MSLTQPSRQVRWYFLLSIAAMLMLAAIGLKISEIQDLRIQIHTAPEASANVLCPVVLMRKDMCLENVIAPTQLSPLSVWFLHRNSTVHWACLYMLVGIAGAIGAYWLRLAGIDRSNDSAPSLARVFVGGFAGVLTFFLLSLPAPLLSRFLVSSIEPRQESNTYTVYRSCLSLGLLAGLFASVFFKRVKAAFRDDSRQHAQNTPEDKSK